MRFSLQVHYAICGIFDLAYNGEDQPVQVRIVGERQQIPTRYLEQIFQRLRRAGLVSGKRGPGGGYVLARTASEISLRDIVEAVEGPIGGDLLEAAPGGEGPSVGRASAGGPDFLWPDLAARFAEVLEEWTLAELCRQAAVRGIRRLSDAPPDYQI